MLALSGKGQTLLGAGSAAAWIALLIYLAMIPRHPVPPEISQRLASLAAHFLTHAVLTFFLYLPLSLRTSKLSTKAKQAIVATAGSFGVAVLLEVAQAISPDRAAETIDLVASGAGAIGGGAVALVSGLIKMPPTWQLASALLTVVGAITVTGVTMAVWDPSLPRMGDHWHARYSIQICDNEIPPLRGTPGGIHTHGDGVIHIHLRRDDEAGRGATLALFWVTSGGALRDDGLTLPSGEVYTDGDRCPNGERGELVVTVDGRRLEHPATYVPRDGDRLTIQFQPVR